MVEFFFFLVIEIVIVCWLGRMELCCLVGVIKIEKVFWGRIEGSVVCFDLEWKIKLLCIFI